MADRGFVLIAGPDGAGKSTVLDAIAARAAARGTTAFRAHYRPHVIAGRATAGGPVTDPHGKPPRSAVASLAKLFLVFADHLVGGNTRWRGQRQAGLLLLERGWFDMAVDPYRYRMPKALTGPIRLLGRVLPRPDLVMLLTGDPTALHARKTEIGVVEVTRQLQRWREVAHAAGRRVLEVDTVRTGPEQAAEALFGSLPARGRAARDWQTVPLTPPRLALRSIGDADPALAVYQPQSSPARAAALVRRVGRIPGHPVPEPLAHLDQLWRLIGIDPTGVVAMQSSTPGRHVLALCSHGRMELVVKIGVHDDRALRNEAAMLTASLHPALPVDRPELLWAGPWREHFVLVTRAAQRCSAEPWTLDEVAPLTQALGKAGADGAALTHGDLTPWNLVRTADGPVLLDWESARWADEPLYDLAHFVVQTGALLNRYSSKRAVALLCDEGSPGWQLLGARGRDGAKARSLLAEYLEQARPTDLRGVWYRTEMLRLVA